LVPTISTVLRSRAGLKELSGLKNLTTLKLDNTKVTAQERRKALPRLRIP
jgi:hypothetical protein